jgi:thioredoxin 1
MAGLLTVAGTSFGQAPAGGDAKAEPAKAPPAGTAKLVDLGSKSCIPCKMMAPVLEGLKTEFPGKLDVEFVDVSERANQATAQKYRIESIPTQVFLDADGKELARHVGYLSRYAILDQFRALGYPFAEEALKPTYSRLEPAQADARPKDKVCMFCDGDVEPKTLVTVATDKGNVRLCSPHCYFIMYSCLTQDKAGLDAKASVGDWAAGRMTPMVGATYVCGADATTGRPTVKAFADRAAAEAEQKAAGGSLVAYDMLKKKELAARCGFCDRAVYPEDAAEVIAGGVHTWGCCSHCALGVAARTGMALEVRQPDRLTGQVITVKTMGPFVVSVEPATAVAWFGKKKTADGKFVSAGCFHQGFFANLDNLKKWAEAHPTETGHMITIDQALADKMKMSPEQIAKACKLGECAPK